MKVIKPSPEQCEAFAKRSLAQLPDSLSARKADLLVLIKILPRKTAAMRTALAMWHALDMSEQAQKEFCFSDINGGAK